MKRTPAATSPVPPHAPGVPPDGAAAFARLRWAALAFLAVWAPSYLAAWGWRNFLQLCDVTVFLTVLGLWRGSALLLSAQAVGSLTINLLWMLDVVARLLTGHHLVGGTEYLWDAAVPIGFRVLTLFHLILPALHLYCVRHTGYSRRGFALEVAIVAVVLVASWCFARPGTNPNFVFAAPLFHRPLGPPMAHLGLVFATQVLVMMLPVHLLLRRGFPRASAGR